jgi:hypothetical protein
MFYGKQTEFDFDRMRTTLRSAAICGQQSVNKKSQAFAPDLLEIDGVALSLSD